MLPRSFDEQNTRSEDRIAVEGNQLFVQCRRCVMRLATMNGGDPWLTDTETRIFDRLMDIVGTLTDADVDAWFRAAERAVADDAWHFRQFRDLCVSADRYVAVAIARLSMEERRTLDLLIEQHPHAYFSGFHSSVQLHRALNLAEVCVRCMKR